MLTEHDMRARYISATLGAIQIDMLNGNMTDELRCSLALRVCGAARAAAQLADDIGHTQQWDGASIKIKLAWSDSKNVVPFNQQRRAR